MRIALAMIVRGTDDEAVLLKRCLSNMAPYVDGIFITRTQPNDAVRKVAKAFKAHLSYFEWVDDFAAARNFNFSQVPKDYDYILWTDTDDMWRGMDKLKSTLAKYPHVDAFGFWYLYDWDEFKRPTVVHRKTMLIKNDGCAKWVGALHEDLEPTRQLDVQLVEGIERLHLSNAERHAENAKRNVRISQKELELKPDDPRSYWNLGNSLFGVSNYDAARKTFNKFIEASQSDEEKYLAHERLADICKAMGDRDGAIRELQLAIGLTPTLPDAYLQLAHLYYTYQDYDRAEEYCLQGLLKKPVIHKMIVFNPRDYDYNPMMLLAQIYYHKNRPDLMLPLLEGCLKIYPKDKNLKQLVKEGQAEKKKLGNALETVQKLEKITDRDKLKTAIEKLPIDVRSHPMVAALRNTKFIKETSSGRDLVIYCGATSHQWTSTSGTIGGSEEAVINLAEELARLGWNVTVYNNCGHQRIIVDDILWNKDHPGQRGQLEYRPFWEFNYRDKQDVVILWRWAKPLDADINAPKVFVDLHDVVPAGEFTEKRLSKVTKIFVKTQFHRSLFPNVPDEKIAVIPNGLDFSLLESNPPIKKDRYLIINTSSPDRCMDVLPKLFKEVKKRVPQAKLSWAYGWDIFKQAHGRDPQKMKWMAETQKAMDDAGIKTLGRLTQAEVGKLYQQASILAYPTEFAEIDCISVKKAQATGCMPITTNFGALDESVQFGEKIHSSKSKDNWNRPYQFHFGLEDEEAQKEWINMVVDSLQRLGGQFNRISNPPLYALMSDWSHQFEWPKIAARWDAILKE